MKSARAPPVVIILLFTLSVRNHKRFKLRPREIRIIISAVMKCTTFESNSFQFFPFATNGPRDTQRSTTFVRARWPMWPRGQSEPANANGCGYADIHGYRGRSAPAGTSGQHCSLLVQPRSPGSADYYYYCSHYYRNEWWWYFLHGMLKD